MSASTPAILTDTTLCTGCEACVTACKTENKLDRDRLWSWQKRIDELSSSRHTTILRRSGGRSVRQQCRHCLDPACVSVCPVGALRRTEEGAVIYDSARCMGCRYCMMACPFAIPRYRWQDPVPLVSKCHLCHHRLAKGQQPACTAACPHGATIFGTRKDLLSEAHRRIKTHPRRYKQTVFGEHEAGGTAVLHISDVDLSFLTWQPKQGDRPLPELTWAALRKIPATVLGVGGAMAGLYWLLGRRMKIAAGGDPTAAARTDNRDEERSE